MRRRRGAVLLVTVTLLAGPALVPCTSDDPADAVRAAAQTFLDDWSDGETEAAAGATSDPATTTALLEQTAADLPDATLSVELGDVVVGTADGDASGDSATVDWTATWDLSAAPDWSYPARLDLRRGSADQAWTVVTAPTLVHPELGAGRHLRLTRTLPERAPITDAAGAPLFTATEVVDVGVDTAGVTDLSALAAALSAVTGVSAEEITADVRAAPSGQFVPVITLRRPDFEAIRTQVFDLPGAVFPTGTRLLAPSPRFAAALLGRVGGATAEVLAETTGEGSRPRYAPGDQLGLSGLQRAYQEQLTRTAGFSVATISLDESTGDTGDVVDSVDPLPGTPVQTPLVPAVQNAADAAVAGQSLATHLVAIRPGTGEILAVSSNEVANAANALTGQFPPGSSMKTMTATALLSAGAITPDTDVPCPPTTTVDGREFENEDQFDLGTVPFTEAFAQSCNTSFIQQARTLPDGALSAAAAGYGVGTDWQLPVDVFSGVVPATSTGTTKAADAIGQGQVLMSPAQLALVVAGIASGIPAAPVEVIGADPAGPTPEGPGQAVLDQLRPMMRQVVLSGTAAGLADRGEVYGKTGTAEFGSNVPPDAHGWFVGYQLGGTQGDIAFAVLVESGQTSSVAVDVSDAFLAGLGS